MPLTQVLDTLLDRAIVPGYSRIGYSLRRTWWPADVAARRARRPHGRGHRRQLRPGQGDRARRGAARRDGCGCCAATPARGERARAEILRGRARRRPRRRPVRPERPRSVRAVAARLRDELPALHALVHNAGVLPPERTETADGHELTVATHVLGPHLLTARCVRRWPPTPTPGSCSCPPAACTPSACASTTPSSTRASTTAPTAYARTKRMQVVLAQLWAAQLAEQHVAVHAMHPGLGRHRRRHRFAAALREDRRPDPAHSRAGRRHRRVAAGRGRGRAHHRAVLARPPPAPDVLRPVHPAHRGRGRDAVGLLRRVTRPRP